MSSDGEKPKKKNENIHKVTFSITIVKAFPTVEEEMKANMKGLAGLAGGRKRVYEAPKPQHYFHLEYKLLPEEEPIKTDLVTYGIAAKVYMETDSKVLKTWKDGDLTWVAWTHNHKLTISRENLLKMYNHTLELKIWDTKDKVSPRARFDRPKAFRLPGGGDDDDDTGVKAQVHKHMMSFEELQPKASSTKIRESKNESNEGTPTAKMKSGSHLKTVDSNRAATAPSAQTYCSTALSTAETPTTAAGDESVMHVKVRVDDQQTPQFGRIAALAGVTPPSQDGERVSSSRDGLDMTSRMSKTKADERAVTPRRRTQENLRERTPVSHAKHSNRDTTVKHKKHSTPKLNPKREMAIAAAAHVRSHGLTTVSIKMSLFFSGLKSTITRVEQPAGHVRDLFLSVNLDKTLLNEVQRKDLNPMVIQVSSACNMPSVPLSFEKLKAKCKPVYLDYQFYDQPRHQSIGREHGSEVYWKDIHVILLGTINKEVLAQYLRGPPLQIEVHDRDRKDEKSKVKPSLFGEKPEDEMINNVALVAGRRTTHNPFKGREKSWDPYGIAKFDLSGILLGQKVLEFRSAIHCCPTPDANLGQENPDGGIVGQSRNIDGPERKPMPSANYLESGSELKIKIDVAYPLNRDAEQIDKTSEDIQDENLPSECPFGRIIYIFQYSNTVFLRCIQSEITAINAEALELENLPKHVIDAALSTYKLSEEQRKSKTLDILTGFQVVDGEYHMFVLEGLANHAIQRLWNRLPRPPDTETSKFNVLYNSEMSFSDRLYASLDVDLCRVRLHEPLKVIVQNPLLYVRDLVPKPCFSALSKLDKLLRVNKLREATRDELFPSAAMVISMSREFGVPLTAEDFGEHELPDQEDKRGRRGGAVETVRTSRVWTPIMDNNEQYEQVLKERLKTSAPERDFVRENIMKTKTASRERPRTIAVDRCDLFNQTAHNYSIQTFNSTELAKEKLRQLLSKEPDSRFTYCLANNSATVLPVDPIAVQKQARLESVERWQTPKGFLYPGKKTSLESNSHIKKPDAARLDELHKPWKENILHANKLKPTVNREVFPWHYRNNDFDLHLKSHDISMVRSVHAAGDLKEQEQQLAQAIQAEKWRSKLVVNDPIFRTHRCLTNTELQDRGPGASNQLAKLKGLLKDSPTKVSLRKPGITLGEIPPLAVVNDPSVDTTRRLNSDMKKIQVEKVEERSPPGYNPGPYENRGWLLEKNKIPIRDPEHRKYQELKGKDFWLFHKERDVLYRRQIAPLKKEERDNNLFPIADTCS